MAILTTEAFVLNRRDLRETSILATFYSKDFGKLKGILKGIRAERSRYGSPAELFSLNKIVFYEKTRSEFQNITQCDLIDGFFGIRKSLTALAHATYLVELVDAMTEPDEKNAEVYESLHRSFKLLAAGEDANKIARIFEVRLLSSLGFAPSEDPRMRTVSKGTAQTLNHLQVAKPEALLKFKISKSIEEEVGMLVDKLLETHLEKPIRSKKFLREIQRLKK
jgi:recombinational DNA repair protein (RecF pathway)